MLLDFVFVVYLPTYLIMPPHPSLSSETESSGHHQIMIAYWLLPNYPYVSIWRGSDGQTISNYDVKNDGTVSMMNMINAMPSGDKTPRTTAV